MFTEGQSFTEEPPRNPFLKISEKNVIEDASQTPSTTPTQNPFLKKIKKSSDGNPLSLTDKYAGVKPKPQPTEVSLFNVIKHSLYFCFGGSMT